MSLPVFCACILPSGDTVGNETPAEHLCFVFPTVSPRGERPRKAPPFPAGVAPPGKSSHASKSHPSRSVRDFQRVGVSKPKPPLPRTSNDSCRTAPELADARALFCASLSDLYENHIQPHPLAGGAAIFTPVMCLTALLHLLISAKQGELCLKIKISLLPSAHP